MFSRRPLIGELVAFFNLKSVTPRATARPKRSRAIASTLSSLQWVSIRSGHSAAESTTYCKYWSRSNRGSKSQERVHVVGAGERDAQRVQKCVAPDPRAQTARERPAEHALAHEEHEVRLAREQLDERVAEHLSGQTGLRRRLRTRRMQHYRKRQHTSITTKFAYQISNEKFISIDNKI